MSFEVGAAVALAVMAVTTYVTRVGGLVIMSRTPITPRVERFLEALSGSVLVALVLPQAVAGDLAAKVAIALAVIVMVATRQTLLALIVSLAAAAAVRNLL